VGGTSKKKKRSSPLLLVDYSGRWDRRFHFEKVGVVNASLPEAVIVSLRINDWDKGISQ